MSLNRTIKLTFIATLASILMACSATENPYKNMPEGELYALGTQELNQGSLKSSIKAFEELDKNYPFGPNTQQVQLNLIYAYYKTSQYNLAIAAIDRFLRLNPTSPYLDWVIYMRGITDMALEHNMIQGWFHIDRYNRDLAFNQTAFKDLSYVVNRYPTSIYSYDAELRLKYLKNQIAKHELGVSQFYAERGAPVAVVNRTQNLLTYFSDTDAAKEGLTLMKNAYQQLQLSENAQKTEQLIEANKDNLTKQEKNNFFFDWF